MVQHRAPCPPAVARIPLAGRLSAAQIAAHNAFITAEAEPLRPLQQQVSQPSRFAGTNGTPYSTTI
ncbi:hypothetical protein BEN47_16725 [Hymenobacter lapidarius]|uniref:Uncharacterized protein n=1 Tax=Hymenobacter lapidarius TaxID=1908237 RepID=A0A1G1SZV1_9BACT|nr:hypothetical protein [Hymenobacter lapidarius]OGX84121.1 hypothetical protein BEN47_16725 [Hymenobacter lapidarius]